MKIGKAEAFLAATLAVAALVVGANRWIADDSAGSGTGKYEPAAERARALGGDATATGRAERSRSRASDPGSEGRSPLDDELGSSGDPLSQAPDAGPRRARLASASRPPGAPATTGASASTGAAGGGGGPPGAVVGVAVAGAGAAGSSSGSGSGGKEAQTSASVPVAPGADALAFASDPEEVFSTKEPQQHGDLGRVSARTGAMSLWVNAEWGAGSQDDAQLLALGDDRLRLVKNVNFLRLEYPNADPPEGAPRYGGIGVPIQGWAADEWHQVTANWNGRNVELYVDGKLVSAGTRDVVDLPEEARLTVGTTNPGNHPVAPGRLAGVELHRRSLTQIEIDHRYNGAQRR